MSKMTRREFSKVVGVTALATGATHTAFGSVANDGVSFSNASSQREWAGGRRVGIRKNAVSWGGGSENIDLLSGNLNFKLPVAMPTSRGLSIGINCSYNAQSWEDDSVGGRNHGIDSGVGHGWSVRIGSIVRQYSGNTVSGCTYVDGTGAEYPLTPSRGVWVSLQGIYVSYDDVKSRLRFPNGTFWELECQSAAGEPDAGTLYPTLIQDRNGNQIVIRYANGAGSDREDSCSRIVEIVDARATDAASGRKTYSFLYDAGEIPRLQSITNHIGNHESWSFTYETQSIVSPFNASEDYGFITVLKSIKTAADFFYTFTYNQYGEMQFAHMPYGARFRWEYTGVRNGIRGVSERGLMLSLNAKEDVYSIRMSQNAETPYTVLTEPGNVATRIWTFRPDGLLNTIDERSSDADKSLHRTTNKWKTTSSGVPYVGVKTVTYGTLKRLMRKQAETNATEICLVILPSTGSLTTTIPQSLSGNLAEEVGFDPTRGFHP